MLLNDLFADVVYLIQLCNQGFVAFRKLLFWDFALLLHPRKVVTFLNVVVFMDEGSKPEYAKNGRCKFFLSGETKNTFFNSFVLTRYCTTRRSKAPARI